MNNDLCLGDILMESTQYLKNANKQKFYIKTISYGASNRLGGNACRIMFYKENIKDPLENVVLFDEKAVPKTINLLIEKYMFYVNL